MMTQIFRWSLVLVLLTPACRFGAPPPPTPTPVTLTYIAIDISDAAEQAIIEQYEMAHAGVTIERRQYSQLPQEYLNAATPPDLMTIGPSHILHSAGAAGLLTDLTDLWAQAGLNETYPPAFRKMSEVGGKQYFLPTAFSWAGFYYNQELFAQYGLVPPETWDEFMLVVDVLRMNGVAPIALAGDSPLSSALWFDYLNLRVNGPQFHSDLMRGRERYDDERVRQVFELWQLLFENDAFMARPSSVNDLTAMLSIIDDEQTQVAHQKAAMVLADPLALGSLPPPLRGQPGYFPFPTIDPQIPVGEPLLILGYMVPDGAVHASQAIDFLTYLSSPEVQEKLYAPGEFGDALAPVSSAADPDYFSEEIRQRMRAVQEADAVDIPYFLGNPPTMQYAIGMALDRFIRDAERSVFEVDELLQRLEEARQQAIANGEFVEEQ